MTVKEEALKALAGLLQAVTDDLAEPLGEVWFERNPTEEKVWEDSGLKAVINLYDGSTGDPEVSLSPPSYEYEHVAKIAIAVLKGPEADATFDTVVKAIGAALDPYADEPGDHTLGGKVDYCELGGLNTDEIDPALAVGFKAAEIPATLTYTTTSPLG